MLQCSRCLREEIQIMCPRFALLGVQFQHIVYSLSRHILYSFGLQNVVGKPAIDEERWMFHEVKFADQGGAEVDMGGVTKAQEADTLAAQGLADEPALSPGIDLALAVDLEHLGLGRILPVGRPRIEAAGTSLPKALLDHAAFELSGRLVRDPLRPSAAFAD